MTPPDSRDALVPFPIVVDRGEIERASRWRSRAQRFGLLLAVMGLLSVIPFTLVKGPPSNVAHAQVAPAQIIGPRPPVASPTVFDVSLLPRQAPDDADARPPSRRRGAERARPAGR